MPPLEAMASGIPVVTTNCGGISEFIEPGYNALVSEVYDTDTLAALVGYLLENKDMRNILAKRGRETALKFKTDKIIIKLEEYLLNIVNGSVNK